MSTTTKRRKKSGFSLGKLIAIVLVIAAGAWYINNQHDTVSADTLQWDKIPQTASATGAKWWDDSYAYRQKVDVTSAKGSFVVFRFDHSALVKTGRSNADGSDLHVVAQLESATEELPVARQAMNSEVAQIAFPQKNYANASYYLYYGNKSTTDQKVLGESAFQKQPGANSTLESIEKPLLGITSTQYWNLIFKDKVQVKLNLDFGADLDTTDAKAYYFVGKSQQAHAIDLSNKSLEVEIEKPKPGSTQIYIVLVKNDNYIRSNEATVMISYPVFVNWTIDWEGNDVKDWVLNAFTNISAKYGIKMTHFFNPRIYATSTIPTYRQGELTEWVLNRHSKLGEEIAMHMHMQYDMIRAAGMEPFTTPRWGTGATGYDVLTTDYNYEQLMKLFAWGLDMFQKHGLPKPAGYRAGGWFANLDTLKAVQDSGFVYDASGRETYSFGAKNQPGFWHLSHTTQPYQPSTTDQNSVKPAPNFNIWEMPNNGNDSYWFEAQQLIDNFYMNYNPSKQLASPKVVTYLSHPDWFDVDQPKIEKLFSEISKYSNAKDKGPVVFWTMSEVLESIKN